MVWYDPEFEAPKVSEGDQEDGVEVDPNVDTCEYCSSIFPYKSSCLVADVSLGLEIRAFMVAAMDGATS